MRIVDAHHHLWNLDSHYYPWLSDQVRPTAYGDYSAIRKNYLLRDFRNDIGSLDVVKSVHVEAGHDPARPALETQWLQEIADNPASDGFPHAIVAFADLSRDDAPALLDRHQRFGNVRGVRQMLHFRPASLFLRDERWRRNLAELAARGLSFDLQIRPSQMMDAADVVELNPRVRFVLDHAGSPPPSPEDRAKHWTGGVARLARLPNVSVKMSGFGTSNPAWTVDSIKPVVLELIGAFGVDRCMFGSNFPVDSLMNSYSAIWSAYAECVEDFSQADKEQLFARTAELFYRI